MNIEATINKINDLTDDASVDEQEKVIKELIEMLERGCTGTSRLLIQTSDQPSLIKWRKESQELINKVRSK